jgi:hypothetical protein
LAAEGPQRLSSLRSSPVDPQHPGDGDPPQRPKFGFFLVPDSRRRRSII